jgi:hypothetical protein
MKTSNFEIGKSYGNDLTITVLAKSAKFVTFKSVFGINKAKINTDNWGEKVYFKCWTVEASELFNEDKAREISYYNAYCK